MLWKSTGRLVISADMESVSDDGWDFSKSMDDSEPDGRSWRITSFSRACSVILICSICFDIDLSELAVDGGSGGSDLVTNT